MATYLILILLLIDNTFLQLGLLLAVPYLTSYLKVTLQTPRTLAKANFIHCLNIGYLILGGLVLYKFGDLLNPLTWNASHIQDDVVNTGASLFLQYLSPLLPLVATIRVSFVEKDEPA